MKLFFFALLLLTTVILPANVFGIDIDTITYIEETVPFKVKQFFYETYDKMLNFINDGFSLPVATAVTLDGTLGKMVVWFEYPEAVNKLKSDYKKDLKPELITALDTFGSDYTDFAYTVEPDSTAFFQWGTNSTSGNAQFEFYPKVIFSGFNNTKTDTEFKEDVNTTIAILRMAVIDFLQTNGASDVSTHIHFTYGSFDFDEGF